MFRLRGILLGGLRGYDCVTLAQFFYIQSRDAECAYQLCNAFVVKMRSTLQFVELRVEIAEHKSTPSVDHGRRWYFHRNIQTSAVTWCRVY